MEEVPQESERFLQSTQLTLTHTHTHSLTYTHSHTHTHTHTHSHTHSHTHTLTHTHTHTLTHTHSHTHTHTLTHTHSQGERVPERDFHVATVVRNRVVVFGGRSDTFAPFFTANDIYPNEFFFYELGKMHSPYLQCHKMLVMK